MATLKKVYRHKDLHVLMFKSFTKERHIYFVRCGHIFQQYNILDGSLVYTAGSYDLLIYGIEDFLMSNTPTIRLKKLDSENYITV